MDQARHDSLIGQRVSSYQVVAKLGAGGMGVVYRATDVRLDRPVALKFLPPHVGGGVEKDRLLQEARAASALDHVNIGTIYGMEETADGQLFIVMAFYEGETLHARIVRQGALGPASALDIAMQMARGLSAAHAKGVIHRDIKPSNVILTPSGVAKIVDFGLAKLAGGESLTRTGSTVGTAKYMSPEQALGQSVDGRSDIWSLGVVLYEMLTGRLPFHGEHIPSTLYAIVHEPPIPMAGAPPELEHIVAKCLAKDLAERYPSMQTLLEDLHAVDSSPGVTTATMIRQDISAWERRASAPGSALGSAGSGARPAPRHWLPAMVLAAVLLAAGALLLTPLRQQFARWTGMVPLDKHIAVLPFSNVANDPGNQALCDGLLETLTSRLSDLQTSKGSLWVVPSSEVRRRKVADAAAARREFGATLVVTGSVQREASGVRLTVNLIDAVNPRQLGSAVLDDRSGDFAALQDATVAKLARLMELENRRPAKEPAAAPAAYESYLKGLGYMQRYDKAGNLDLAVQLFEQARQSDPRFALAYAGLAEASRIRYETTRDATVIPQVTEYCNQAILLDAQLAPAYITLGRIHDGTGQHELAVQEFRHAMELEPRNPDAMEGMARAYESAGRIKEAEDLLKRATALRPDYWEGFNRLGAFYHKQRRFEDAVPQFQRVLQLTPDNVAGYSNLAASYMQLERWSDAQKLLEKALQLSPSYAIYSNLGLVYLNEDRYADAGRTFEGALRLNDKDYRVWSNAAIAYSYAGSDAKAQAAFRRAAALAEPAARLQPQDAGLQANLGRILAWLNRRDEALIRVQAALARAPDDPQVLKRAAETYERLGMRAHAVEAANRALDRGYTWNQLQRNRELAALLKEPGLKRK